MRTVAAISSRLNEDLPLPYKFNVLDYASISTPELVEHIDQYGRPLTFEG